MIHKIEMPTPFHVGSVNAFVIKGDALSIVDVGVKTKEAYEALAFGLKQLGYNFNDVEQIILTHHHPDHVGWIDAFPKATILGHAYNDVWLKGDATFLDYAFTFYIEQLASQGVPSAIIERSAMERRRFEHVASRPLDYTLKNGEDIPGHSHFKAIYTPGHALSHMIYVNERQKLAIGGDLLLPHIIPNPLIEPPAVKGQPRAKAILQYNTSLQTLYDLHLAKVYPNHGEMIVNPNVLIEDQMNRFHKQAMRLLSYVTEQPQSTFDLNAQYYATLYKAELALTLSKTQGYIDYLIAEELLHEELTEQGIYVYSLKK